MSLAHWNWLKTFRRRLNAGFSKAPPPSKFTRRRSLYLHAGPVEALEQRLVPALMVMGATANETAGMLTFSIIGDGTNTEPLLVNYTTVDGPIDSDLATPPAAVAPADYIAISGALTIAAFDMTSHYVVVTINNDTDDEGPDDEEFILNVTGDEFGSAIGTIADDDGAPADPTGPTFPPTDPTNSTDPPTAPTDSTDPPTDPIDPTNPTDMTFAFGDIDTFGADDEANEEFWIASIDDAPLLPAIDTDYFDPADYTVHDDLVPITLSAMGTPGLTVEITVSDSTVVQLWEDADKIVSFASGTTFMFGSSPGMPSTIYAEGLAEGTAFITLNVYDPADTTTSLANDQIKANVVKNKNPDIVANTTKFINFNDILAMTTTPGEKALAIQDRILSNANFKASDFAPFVELGPDWTNDGDLPDRGIAMDRILDAAAIELWMPKTLEDGSVRKAIAGSSGWVMGWKLAATALQKRFYDFSQTRIRFMAWYTVIDTTSFSPNHEIKIATIKIPNMPEPIPGDPPTTEHERVVAHELMHTDGIKAGAQIYQRGFAAGIKWVTPPKHLDTSDFAPINQAMVRIGYTPAFSERKVKTNQKINDMKSMMDLTDEVALQALRQVLRENLIGSVWRNWYSEAGEWHGGGGILLGAVIVYRKDNY